MPSLGPINRSWKRRVAALASIAALALLLAAPSFAEAGPRDRDRDGLSNRYEVGHSKTNPTRGDTDRDHLGDGFEVRRSHTNPLKRDTDGDGLTDAYEWRHSKTSPLRKDTDRDGTADGVELMLREDPLANERGKKQPLRDRISPQTAITAGPSGTVTNRDPGFLFTSSEAGSSFQCKLDAAAWGSCASPRGYSGVADGLHNFSVRATDPAGNVDPTPDTRAWTVAVQPPPPVLDTTPPDTAITSGPSGTVANGNASFSFSASEIGSSFQCRLDAAAWSNCSSPHGYSGLAGGTHTFSVRATDLATNTDPSPATASWTVATTAGPTASFSWSPQNPQNPPVQVTFTSTGNCPATPCTYDWRHGAPGNEPIGTGTTASWTFQSTGTKTVVLKVTDSAGRVAEATNNITVGSAPAPKRCANGVDDDGDGLTDLADPDCVDASDDDESNVVQPPPDAPTLTQVDGGTNYYAGFSNPLPTDPSYFPIGVWGSYNHTQANRDLDAAAGLNTYVWVADTCNGIPAIRADGRFRVIFNQSDNRSCIGSESSGWVLSDEIDMSQGPTACNGSLQTILNGLPQDGRFRYNNYGKGVMFWESDAEAACFVNKQHVTSNDIYWLSDTNSCSSSSEGPAFFNMPAPLPDSVCRRPANYGHTVDRMRFLDAMDGNRQPIWNFVETAQQGNRKPLAPEIRAAVWHSIIAGARGIIYFQHAWNGSCLGDHHTIRSNCEGTRQVVVDTDAQVKSLAPVLNAPTVSSGVSSTGPVRAMVKWSGGKFYVFAGSTGTAGTGTVSIPCVGNATAVKLGETNDSRAVTNGSFSDSFADKNAVHIYRLDGGSSCGL